MLKRILISPFVLVLMAVGEVITNSFTNHQNEPFWPTFWHWLKTGNAD